MDGGAEVALILSVHEQIPGLCTVRAKYNDKDIAFRYIAPRCGEDIEETYVDLALRSIYMTTIYLNLEDLKLYNDSIHNSKEILFTDGNAGE